MSREWKGKFHFKAGIGEPLPTDGLDRPGAEGARLINGATLGCERTKKHHKKTKRASSLASPAAAGSRFLIPDRGPLGLYLANTTLVVATPRPVSMRTW